MKKYYFFGLIALFALVSCNKNDVLNDNTNAYPPSVQRAGMNGEIIYVDNVNKEIAGNVATTFLTSIEGVSQESAIFETDSIVDWEGKTAMYVFNFQPTGYVFTSTDVRNEPIIAYSKDKNFILTEEDELPDALKNRIVETIIGNKWLQDGGEGWDGSQEMLQNNVESWLAMQDETDITFKLDPEKLANWVPPCYKKVKFLGASTIDYGYYCTTTWGQLEPYNFYAPNNYPAGCVAVAFAQIMKFHQYPSDWYNWSIMPNKCTSTYNSMSSGDLEVASLLSDH